jgi:hypothetical protein
MKVSVRLIRIGRPQVCQIHNYLTQLAFQARY